jgi:hypothetical protein
MTEEEYKRWKERLRSRVNATKVQEIDQQVEKIRTAPVTAEPDVSDITAEIAPEVLEARQIAEQEVSTGRHITGTALGVTAELGTGLALTHKLHRSQKYLQWLNNAKRISTVGVLAPEPTTTVGGVVGLAATEAAIWATSNFIGQKIRQAYGLQDKVSGGEMIAASVFGVGLVTKTADKFIRLGPGIGAANAWKGREMLVKGVNTFVSGAALGVAESALRQEIEAQLNGKDRDEYDYLFSGLAGGTFNSLFSVWSRTGKWGRGKAAEAAENAKARIDNDIKDLKDRLKEMDGRGRGSQFKIKKEIEKLEQGKDLIDDSINEIKTADEALSKQETNPKEVEDIDEPLIKKEEEVVEEPEVGELPETLRELKQNFISKKLAVPAREGEFPFIETPEGYFKQGNVYRHKDDPNFKVEQTDAEGVVKLAEDIANEAGGEGVYNLRRHMGPMSNPEAASKALREKAEELAPVQQAQRDLLRQKYGDTVTVYRVEDPDFTPSPERDVSSWSLEKKSVEDRLLVEGTVLKEKTIAVDDVQFVYNYRETEVLLRDDAAPVKPATKPELEVEEPEIPRVVDDEREDAFDVLRDRVSKINNDNISTELPLIEREAKKVYNRTYRNLNDLTRRLSKNADDTEALEEMLAEVKFFRKLNTEVKDIAETTGGRTLQAARRDADKYRWLSKYSYRSRLEDAALGKLEISLEAKLGRTTISEDADIKDLFDDFVKIKPRIKEAGKKIDKKVTKRAEARKKKEVTEQQKAEKLKKAFQTKIGKLQKELDDLRKRFGDDIALEEAQAKVKKKKPKDPRIVDLEDRIRFYKEAEAEVGKIEQLEANLARLADIEGRGVISELRKEVAPKPTGPTKPSKVKELQKKISDSKKRMKQKLADLDRVVAKEAKEKQDRNLYNDMEQAFFAALEADAATKGTKFIRGVKQARQMALIDQLPSVFAGVPTGIGAGFKQFFRVPAAWLSNLPQGLSVANKMFHIEASAAFKMLTDLNGLGEALRRTFAENISATDRRAGRLADEISTVGLPRGEHALIAKAARDAKRRAEAVDNVSNSLASFVLNGKWHEILSLGVRGIQSVDELFKRQIVKSRIYSESNKKALLEFPNDPAKQQQRAEELYNSAWVDSDGLEVLNDTHQFMDEVNQVREELLFASNTDDLQDVYVSSSEKLINALKDLSNDDGLMGFVINAFLPYIGVPIRAVYRGARLVAAPAKRTLGLLEVSPFELPRRIGEQANPYNKIIRNIELEMDVVTKQLAKSELDDAAKASFRDEFNLLDERLKTAQVRRAKYNNELLTDGLIGVTIAGIGYAYAQSGAVTGSLAWLTDDQRKKSGLESFKAFGSDYSAALPWSFPLALYADLGAFYRIKDIEEEKGIKILTKDQNVFSVLKQSFIQLSKAMPLAEGVKNFEEIVGGEGEVLTSAFSRLVASYVPVPAQARKIVQAIEAEGDASVADLRGGTFYERMMYSVLGVAPTNKKTDLLGNDLISNKTAITEAIVRQAPRRKKSLSDFEKIVATDTHGNIRRKPATLYPGIRMTEFRNSDGMTLSYAFDRRLRDTQVRIKGKKQYIEDAVFDLINSSRWLKKFDKGFVASETNPDVLVNEGLKDLDSLLQKFYKQTQKDMLKDTEVLDDFINRDDVSLYEIMENLEMKADEGGQPISILEVLSAD